jgi:hypothetical protein
MVVLVGLALSATGVEIPDTSRLVGATLVVLGAYVLWSTVAGRGPTSRGELVQRVLTRWRQRLRPKVTVVHEHVHDHDHVGHEHGHPVEPAVEPEVAQPVRTERRHRHAHAHRDLPAPYTVGTTMTIGFVHGLGAETPTQVLAVAGGAGALLPFIGGLAIGNTLVASLAVSTLSPGRARLLNATAAVFSLLVGVPYLLGTTLVTW